MLGRAPFAAFQVFTFSVLVAAPAAAQTRDAQPVAPARACVHAASLETSTQRVRRPAPEPTCNQMRQGVVEGGWLGHAIMHIDLTRRPLLETPTPASTFSPERAGVPPFARPVERH